MPPAPHPPPADGPDFGPATPWLACVAPLVVFLLLGILDPTPTGGGLAGSLGIPYSAYPLLYSTRLMATIGVLALCWPAIGPWLGRPTWWPPLAGLLLAVPWVVLASLQRQAGWGGGIGERSAFDPFAALGGDTPAAWGFLIVRAIGLVAVVPLAEELFLRGFLLRWVVREDFWRVPFGTLTAAAAAACLGYAVATHPAEAVAAAGWFSIVSGIAAATRRPIDTIIAHAATNLAIGAWVLATGQWWLV